MITITGGFPTAGGSGYSVGVLLFIIQNVNNPSLTSPTALFTAVIKTSGGVVRDTLVDSGFYVKATPGPLASCQITSSSDVVGATATATVQFKTNNKVPQGGYLQLVVPLWNPDNEVSSDIVPMLVYPGITCGSPSVSNYFNTFMRNKSVFRGSIRHLAASGQVLTIL